MNKTDSVFQRAVSKLLTEIFNGPPGAEAYILNPGDPGLHRQLETISASTASRQAIPADRPLPLIPTMFISVYHFWYVGCPVKKTPLLAPTGMEAGNAQPLRKNNGARGATVSARKPMHGRKLSPLAPTGTTSPRQARCQRLHTPRIIWVRSARFSEQPVDDVIHLSGLRQRVARRGDV